MNLANTMDMCKLSAVPTPVDTKAAAGPIAGASGILVVEDEAVIRDLLTMILEQRGYGVRLAVGGHEARRLIADLKSRPEFSELIRSDEKRILAGVERFDGFYLTDAGQPREALRSYGRAFRLYPKMAAQDWKHILLAFLSLLGLEKVRRWYDRLRTRRLHLD